MSVELLYIMILLLAFLFINEHFISKELREKLLKTSFMKDIAVTIGDEAISEVYRLAQEVDRLQKKIEDDETEEQEEDSKVVGA